MPGDPGPELNIPSGIRKGRWEDHEGLKKIAPRARRGGNLRAMTLLAPAAVAAVLAGMVLAKLGSSGNHSDPPRPTSQAHASAVKESRLIIASTIVAQPSSQVPVQVRIDPFDETPRGGILHFRGLTSGISLSEGNAVAGGAWIVPLARISNLKVFVAPDVSGRRDISISLVGLDETILAEVRTTLIIGPDPGRVAEASSPSSITKPVSYPTEHEQFLKGSVEQPRPVSVEASSLPSQSPVVAATPLIDPNKAHIDGLLVEAAQCIEMGDVNAARELLVGADDGRQGAILFALAETYDPNMLAAWGTRDVAADAVKARALYQKAIGLGVAQAQNRLDALN
jgi:hypothetical protein